MLERLPNWDMGALTPSGGLKSTANNLLTLLRVALSYSRVDYFCKLFDEQITFKVDSQGLTTGLIYTRNGMGRQAQRMK
jgi:hypothetical protein